MGMLADFIDSHREQIIARCRRKVAERLSPPHTPAEIDHGVPMFLDELTAELRVHLSADPSIAITAAQHGHDLMRRGFTPSQVVHDYGDVCQTITEMVIESHESVSANDFRMLNRCLDDAIASAITEYERARTASASTKAANEGNRLRVLGDALRATVLTGRGAFDAVQSGNVGIDGSTARVLARCLQAVEDLNESIQAEIAAFARG
jgi:hypothetical protein